MPRRRRRNPPPGESRPSDHSPPLLPRVDFLLAALLGAGVLVVMGIVILISRGGTTDAEAIQSLARRSIEALPKGEWPSLYDSYTSDFRQRCSREDFERAGVESAQALGADLDLLGFKRLEQLAVTGDSATGVIVGELKGTGEYTLSSAFRREDGDWKIAPVPGVEGCAAFQRLSG